MSLLLSYDINPTRNNKILEHCQKIIIYKLDVKGNKSFIQTISSSCYDALVIKQENRTYKSTPFQVVFSSNLIKQI